MPTRLTLRSTLRIHDTTSLVPGERVVNYDVDGLPTGQRAYIYDKGRSQWRVVHIANHVLTEWPDTYERADDALLALECWMQALTTA